MDPSNLMAALGNIGHAMGACAAQTGWQFFGLDKRPVGVDMALTGVLASTVPNSYIVLTRNAVYQFRSRTDSSGNGHFYDMDDSGDQVYSIVAYTQAGPTGEAWTATVSGSTATVTKVFAAQRAMAFAFT